jgi:AraC family transcriptional regulator of adaptative response / DNA-3-methyladenine glycosylase II
METDDITLRLAYRPPLAFAPLLRYLAARATPGVEAVDANEYARTVALETQGTVHRGWLRVRAAADRALLEVRLSPSLAPVLMPVTQRLRSLFDLDADPVGIDRHLALDDALRESIRTTPGLRVPGAWDVFEISLRAVLGQQISVAGASRLAGRLTERFGARLATPHGSLTRLAPTASRLARASTEDIASIGLPRARAETVLHVARFAESRGLAFEIGTTLEALVDALVAIPGIGPWTAQYIAMRALRHPDAFPAGDLGLRKAMGRLEHASGPLRESALAVRSEVWRPWRAYAAEHLWHSLHTGDAR